MTEYIILVIQVSELNDLAAILIIMQWKRMIGFYASDKPGCIESVLSIAANKILNQYEVKTREITELKLGWL